MKHIPFIFLLAITFLLGWITNPLAKKTLTELDLHREYYNKTEELLDSMCASDSAFIGLTKTNVYNEYLEIRNNIRVVQTPE